MKIVFDTHGNEKQKDCARAWKDESVIDIAYGGSKGSAKSYTGCALIFGDAFMYPGTHYFIARKQLNDLRKFTIPSVYETLDNFKIPRTAYKYNGQDNLFETNNKSKIFLLEARYLPGDELYERFGSMQMTRGWIEEAGEIDENAKNNLAASTGRWKNDLYGLSGKILQTCNPSKNYLYREYYKKFKSGTLESWKRFIQALPGDNKMLSKGYIENLERNLSKNQKERLLYGNWEYDDDPAILMDYEAIIDIFSNTYVASGRKCITCDAARLGGDRIVIIEWDGYRGLVRWKRKQALDVTARDIEESRNKIACGKSDVIVDEDGIGGGIVDFYKCKGFVNNSSPIQVPGKEKENFDNLKSQCSFRMADLVNKKSIYLECQDSDIKDLIIEEMEQIKQKDIDGEMKKGVVPKDEIKKKIGRSPDFWDAIMMRAYFDLVPHVNTYRPKSYSASSRA